MRAKALFMMVMLALAMPMGTFIVGCETLEQATPTTTQERLVAANEGVSAVVVAATNSLNARAISSKQAEAVSSSAKEAQRWLGLAEEAFNAGDTSTGEANLAVAETLLRSLRALLAQET